MLGHSWNLWLGACSGTVTRKTLQINKLESFNFSGTWARDVSATALTTGALDAGFKRAAQNSRVVATILRFSIAGTCKKMEPRAGNFVSFVDGVCLDCPSANGVLGSCALGNFGMDRFVNEQNLEIFRQLASGEIGEVERRVLLERLAEQEAELLAALRKSHGESKRRDVADEVMR